jgi:hypothetical protein
MSNFMGGSAYAMARDIAEGYCQATERTFRRMSTAEMNQLSHEMDRYMRELRGEATAGMESTALQARNRKLQRLNSAMVVLRNLRQQLRR